MLEEAVVLINAFEVPAGDDETFLRGWEHARDFMRTQPGFQSARLHRSLWPSADFRFVNVAVWASAAAFRAATSQPRFRDAAMPYRFHAALYEVAASDDITALTSGPARR